MIFLWEIVKLGLSNLRRHKLRSFLTALGIILGVAAVITNSAIGEGSKRAALDQIERLGATNIIIRSTKPPESASGGGGGRRSFVLRYGLTREDLAALRDEFGPAAQAIVSLKSVGGQVLRDNLRRTSQAFGTTPDLAAVANLRVERGRYLSDSDMEERAKVAVIGAEVAKSLYPGEDPVGQGIRIDSQTFTVVGVLQEIGLAAGSGTKLVGRDLNQDIHLPLTTAEEVFGDTTFRAGAGSMQSEAVQVSEVYVLLSSRDEVMPVAALLRRFLDARRPGMPDVSMYVPLELLEQARNTALTWTVVLTLIAGISLLVGGIGIMNIMLASVTERTREIGIRRALGATRHHITLQFLVETGVLSAVGGMAGVALGVGFSIALGYATRWLSNLPGFAAVANRENLLQTQLEPVSIVVAFCVASATGLVFGLYPAIMAAKQDPIVALRHD